MVTGPEQTWRDAFVDGRFLLQHDALTGHYQFPPRLKPAGETSDTWIDASGMGTVHSVTIVRKRAPESDYTVALIDLDEGPRLMSRVEGIPPADVAIGMRVAMHRGEIDGIAVALFHPA